MKKFKFENKYFLLTVLVIFAPILVFFVLENYLIRTVDFSLFFEIIIVVLFSLIPAIVITIGLSVFNPTITEAVFTLRRLLRFESLSNPLLLKLSIMAPGTYHHSLNVSNLAQRAGKSIGANTLLIRTAAYYHDIGKLNEPALFVENQAENEIPEAKSADQIRGSAKKIISHIENGIKIAEENNIPEEMIDLIAEHHGTTYALYFYKKAVEKGLKIKKTDFRYSGPKPQSKESAVLMISDCVEAAVRAEQYLNKDIITQIVDNLITERITEGQFKHADLSENDIVRIKNSLIDTLMSIYHQRIIY